MRSFLAGRLFFVTTGATDRFIHIGERGGRSFPLVALFLNLPGFRSATFEAHVPTWIGRTAKADFIPGIWMGIIRINRILHQQQPEVHHGHLFPNGLSCWRITIVDGLEHLVLFAWPELYEGLMKQMLSNCVNGLQAEAMGFMIGRHILKTIAVDAPVIEPI